MWSHFLDFLFETLLILTFPLVHMYHALTSDFLFNVADEKATGIEEVANTFLTSYQYLFAGRKATIGQNGQWHFEPRFPVDDQFWVKVPGHLAALPFSITVGGIFKGLSLIFPEVREKYHSMRQFYRFESITPMRTYYESVGIEFNEDPPFFSSLGLPRRPGDENNLKEMKECLQEIGHLLNEAQIPWWLDSGSCIGAYRYGGVIPWDEDIDIGVLLPDFDNVLCALSRLDKDKYLVQDWSGRDHPKSYIKVFLRETNTNIDIYHFAIDPAAKEVRYILSLENHLFLPEWWKIRERRFKVPTPFREVFPLQKAMFDGVAVFLPADPEKYLQKRYGENLAPAKVYNPMTNKYEKDLTHPYWSRPFVH